MSGMEIEEFKPLFRNSLRGFIRVRLPSGMILHDVAVHQSKGSAWASTPSKPMIGRDGVAMKDQNGKIKYQPIVEFSSRELRDKFSRAVIETLRAMHPEALADE